MASLALQRKSKDGMDVAKVGIRSSKCKTTTGSGESESTHSIWRKTHEDKKRVCAKPVSKVKKRSRSFLLLRLPQT